MKLSIEQIQHHRNGISGAIPSTSSFFAIRTKAGCWASSSTRNTTSRFSTSTSWLRATSRLVQIPSAETATSFSCGTRSRNGSTTTYLQSQLPETNHAHHHKPLLCSSTQADCPHPAGAGSPEPAAKAALRQAATCTDQRQPGPALDQPVPLGRSRRLRRPELSRQLRRQPYQGLAALLQTGQCPRSDDRQWHLPRRLQRTGHLLLVQRSARRCRRLRCLDNSPARCFDFCWIHPPYWRQKLYTEDQRCLSRDAHACQPSWNATAC